MRFLFILLVSFSVFGQKIPDTHIFLFDIKTENNDFEIGKGKIISQNKGYNNQPSFYDNEELIYSGIRDGETDIAQYNLKNSKTSWISNTPTGSEFSPQRIPETTDIAAVRLETSGLQLLYKYDYQTGKSKVLIPGAKIGYFAFYDQNKLLAAELGGSGLDLMSYDLEKNSSEKIITNIGRSIQKVPGNTTMSYTLPNDEGNFDIYLFDPDTGKSFFVCELPDGTQDFTWLDANRILTGVGSKLYIFDTFGGEAWVKVADLTEYGITGITRLAVNAYGTKLALVGNTSK
ncbi:hypothetical protein C7S20_04185 [Christiangramia fulva]|uniref:Secretion protein n=1 Tax=Christiangramia fulva TaxID=2126553 RepID=A0A2R3Z2N2_9FLAO|nr:hypothetical protein [Christiangramia fulva]AVR44524.1 hypothetical protein C7S20_04185 [Christiangramia fulva]